MQIQMVLQLRILTIYGQEGVKCHLLSSVVFEIAGFETRLINKLQSTLFRSDTVGFGAIYVGYQIVGLSNMSICQ